MIGFRGSALLLSLSLCALAGCMPTLAGSPLPDGFAVRTLAKVDAGGPLALSRTGNIATVAQGSLQVFSASGGPGRSIAAAPATDLRFSPGGERLAASFATSSRTLLRIFDLRGNILAEALIPGKVTSLAWRSEKELLASALEIKKFSFGSELVGSLYRWDTVHPPLASPLSDVTVRPRVASLPEETLFRSLTMALSPYGDEIAYSSMKDPPVYNPYLRIAVRHLESGAERGVAEVGIGSGGALYTPDGESLLTGDTQALTHRLSLPDGKETDAWPTPGDRLALSPSGSYLLLDGRLYRGGREIVSFPRESTGVFLPDGSGLAISAEGALFLVDGLQDPQAPALPGELKRVLELRRLRMLGLITDQEFKARMKKVSGREK